MKKIAFPMLYKLIDTKEKSYAIIDGTPFVNFNAGNEFIKVFENIVGSSNFSYKELAHRPGSGDRRESLFEVSFTETPSHKFYVYCFQTEGGGRTDLPQEQRVQWRSHGSWTPDLSSFQVAKKFKDELPNGNVIELECYLLAFYKRSQQDTDILVSAIYPTQAQDVESTAISPKSIQYKIEDMRKAYLNGVGGTKKGNGELIVHFKPERILQYMLNRDEIHVATLERLQERFDATKSGNPRSISPTETTTPLPNISRNRILFGPPGTGKSSKIKATYANSDTYSGLKKYRVTFHPDYEYGSFVGSYKPVSVDDGHGRKEIQYDYVPQEFINAYTEAWNDPTNPHFLIIEEINRGNCAQIFGDLFQSLDRNAENFSEYEVNVDADLAKYLIGFFAKYPHAAERLNAQLLKHGCKPGEHSKIILPDNLYLYATMNTSDQSLFPMDSAFKRRWDWEYVPIDYKPCASDGNVIDFTINLDGVGVYSWSAFIEKANKRIYDATRSEDKQLGFWFIKPSSGGRISKVDFKAKVLFYLWFEVFRNEQDRTIFPTTVSVVATAETESFVYGHLFEESLETGLLKRIMDSLGLELIPSTE